MVVLMLGACGDDETPPEPILNGEACEIDGLPCESGLCVETLGDNVVPGGFCTAECEWGENPGDPDTCAEGEVCLRYNPTQEFFCFQECISIADCRGDEDWDCLCLDFFCSVNVCIPPL